jgi:hypothetical protein
MAVDKDFIERFNEQIRVLENIKESVEGAIKTAKGQLKRIEAGEPMDDVFATK